MSSPVGQECDSCHDTTSPARLVSSSSTASMCTCCQCGIFHFLYHIVLGYVRGPFPFPVSHRPWLYHIVLGLRNVSPIVQWRCDCPRRLGAGNPGVGHFFLRCDCDLKFEGHPFSLQEVLWRWSGNGSRTIRGVHCSFSVIVVSLLSQYYQEWSPYNGKYVQVILVNS